MTARAAGLAILVAASLGGVQAAAASAPRASLTELEMQVMCVTCGVPLSIAESPQANDERDFIRGLIDRGETSGQIKRALVGQFGTNVLALPERRGFNLAVYLVPIGLIAILAATLAVAVPRWRRAGADATVPPPLLSAAEDARLDAELARFRE